MIIPVWFSQGQPDLAPEILPLPTTTCAKLAFSEGNRGIAQHIPSSHPNHKQFATEVFLYPSIDSNCLGNLDNYKPTRLTLGDKMRERFSQVPLISCIIVKGFGVIFTEVHQMKMQNWKKQMLLDFFKIQHFTGGL